MKLVKLDIAKGEEFVTKTITVLDGINRLQAEKSSVVESYNRVKQEYYAGKISFAVYKATVERMNAEVDVIDSMINEQIKTGELAYESANKYVSMQRPVPLRFVAEKGLDKI